MRQYVILFVTVTLERKTTEKRNTILFNRWDGFLKSEAGFGEVIYRFLDH